MEEHHSPVFTHAKMEYTNQLIDILTPHFFDGINSIYDEAKTINNINKKQSIIMLFRTFLEKVPSWSNVIIETETDRIINTSKCDWLDDLITAVFISHTKILTSIGTNVSSKNIDLTIPKTINFIHKCYINIAREMWKNPYLFNEFVVASEYQKNMRTIELIIKESTENTIRSLSLDHDIPGFKKCNSSNFAVLLAVTILLINLPSVIDIIYIAISPSRFEYIATCVPSGDGAGDTLY